MAAYIAVILAAISFSAQFIFTKKYEQCIEQSQISAMTTVFATGIFGAFMFACVSGFHVEISEGSVLMACIFALLMIPYFSVGIQVLAMGSLPIYSMFMMLGGMLLPFAYGVWFLREPITLGKGLGCMLLSGCIGLQALCDDPGTGIVRGQRLRFFLLCIGAFLVNGLTGVVASVHQDLKDSVDEVSFTVLYCLFSAVFSLVAMGLFLTGGGKERKLAQLRQTLNRKPLGYCLLLGGAMHAGNYLVLLAADRVPASVQFPLISGGTIVLSAVLSVLVFRKKMERVEAVTVTGALLATILFGF